MGRGARLACIALAAVTAAGQGAIMQKMSIVVVAFALIAVRCGGSGAPQTRSGASVLEGGVVHRVSVGSHDQLPPGGDANFSLIALEQSDGTMTGEWSDQF